MKTKYIIFFCTAIVLAGCKKKDEVDKSGNDGPSCSVNCPVNPLFSSDYHANIHSGLKGTYQLKYSEVREDGPFENDDAATFTITNDGKLVVEYKDKCVTIEKALVTYQTDVEVNFRDDDCVFNVTFAVSDNITGELHEINILKNSLLMGQFYKE